jgi:hypothetical protein
LIERRDQCAHLLEAVQRVEREKVLELVAQATHCVRGDDDTLVGVEQLGDVADGETLELDGDGLEAKLERIERAVENLVQREANLVQHRALATAAVVSLDEPVAVGQLRHPLKELVLVAD